MLIALGRSNLCVCVSVCLSVLILDQLLVTGSYSLGQGGQVVLIDKSSVFSLGNKANGGA
jgi:hypothetical protein